MRRSREYLSMPIISVSEGQQIGTVRGLIINPKSMEVAALLVDQKGFFKEQRVIPYTKVKSVGDHAITVDRISNAEKVINLPEIVSLLKDKVALINTKVITETGKVLGVVEEFYIDTKIGKIISLEVANNFLTGLFKGRARLDHCDLITMGKDVIIAAAGAEERLSPADTGISETLKTVVDSTTNLWYSSLQRTKDLSKHLAKGKNHIELPPTDTFPSKAEIVQPESGSEDNTEAKTDDVANEH